MRASRPADLNGLPAALLSSSSLGTAALSKGAPVLVECPKCAKRTIVKRSHNTFDCLNCNFHKELPPVAGALRTPLSLSSGLPAGLPPRGLGGLGGVSGQPNHPANYSNGTLLAPSDDQSDKMHPLIFAALAVLFGIVLL